MKEVIIEKIWRLNANTFLQVSIFGFSFYNRIETVIQEEDEGQKKPSVMFIEDKYFTIMVAGGPFTPQNAFDLSPLSMNLLVWTQTLDELLGRVLETKPNFVILLGPFLDINNEAVKLGELKLGNSDTYLDYYHTFELIINFINDRIKTLPVSILVFEFNFSNRILLLL